jgi:signal peptidase II
MNFAVFNVADICITVGGALLVIYVLFFYEKYEKKGSDRNAHGTDLPTDDI